MVHKRKVAVVIGSLRKGSSSRMMAQALMALNTPSLELTIVEIGDLPLYNEDLETDSPPSAWTSFRSGIAGTDAVLFVTPEYNRSMPGALKNALDVGSRPYGKSVWQGKPGAVVSLSPGKLGAFGANHHLRQSLVFLDIVTLAQPEAYIGGAFGLFDTAGGLIDNDTKTFLQSFMNAFAALVEKLLSA